MKNKDYFFQVISNYLNNKKNNKTNNKIQTLYNQFGYGYNSFFDSQLLALLEEYNRNLEIPYLASGQNGYFNDQIEKNGLCNLKVDDQDLEDASFIASCFGKEIKYKANNITCNYATLLGTREFDYAVQSFPAGFFEDVFQCYSNHNWPIQPLVGETEEDFYLRILNFQMNQISDFDSNKKSEIFIRAKRLLNNFLKNKNRVYFFHLEDVLNVKASFGDIAGLRDGTLPFNEAQEKIKSLYSLEELLSLFSIEKHAVYNNPNMTSDYGIALYENIPFDKLKYIEVERLYDIKQKRAIDLGYNIGDVIPEVFDEDYDENIVNNYYK